MSESGRLRDGSGSCEDQTDEGRRSGCDTSGDGEGEDEGVATGDESGDKGDDSSTRASNEEIETSMVARGAAVRAGEVSGPED